MNMTMTNFGFWNSDHILWIHNKNITVYDRESFRILSLLN